MTAQQVRSVPYGSRTLTYALRHSARGSLAITVDPNGQISATAPIGSNAEEVDLRVRSKARWITEKQLEYARFTRRSDPDRLYVSGSLHPYLGRRYRLRVRRAAEWSLVFRSGVFNVWGPDTRNASQVSKVLQEWYTDRSELVFGEQLEKAIMRFRSRTAIAPQKVTIRRMERRWGSMTPAGSLVLNARLIEHAKPLIEYVITHELAHRLVPDHSARFWSTLRRAMPDWQSRKDMLEHRVP